MDYQKETIKTYDSFPASFDEKFESHFQEFARPEADFFIRQLRGKKIVDLGSGPGNHARYFQQRGLDVLCVDLSKEMIRLCQEKGLKSMQADVEKIQFPENSLDGVWSYTCLLHIPKKKITPIASSIASWLKLGGLLGLAFIEGKSEGFKQSEDYPDTKRWFSYYSEQEVRKLFEPFFECILFERQKSINSSRIYLKFVFRKK